MDNPMVFERTVKADADDFHISNPARDTADREKKPSIITFNPSPPPANPSESHCAASQLCESNDGITIIDGKPSSTSVNKLKES
jgi:hypothetical protein